MRGNRWFEWRQKLHSLLIRTAVAMSTVTDGKIMVYPRHAVTLFEDCCISGNAKPIFECRELTGQKHVFTPEGVHKTSDC